MVCKRLHIFRSGRHTATDGRSLTFSAGDLAACAAAYDPAVHEAPIVVGHPTMNAPAYGWVSGLHFDGSDLYADAGQVEPQFAELVNAGRFKKISASLYMPDSPGNPTPGKYYIRHVGFLGAAPPAVKGLRDASFAAAEEGLVEFSDWADVQSASLWRRLRDFLISKHSLEEADSVIPDYAVASLEREAQRADSKAEPVATYTEPTSTMTKEEIEAQKRLFEQQQQTLAASQAALQADQASFAEQRRELDAQLQTQRRAGFVAFTDDLVKAGKALPVHRDGLVAFMETISAGAGTVEFGEGDAKVSQPALAWLQAYLTAQPKLVTFGEVVTGEEESNTDSSDPVAFAEAINELRENERKAGREISFAQAASQLQAKQAAS